MSSENIDNRALWQDYFELTKPKVVALMILTSVIGMLLSVDGFVPLDILILGNLGIALCAGSAAAINHVVDRQIDLKMARTKNRPIATGRVEPLPALTFSVVIGAIGLWILLAYINVITAVLTVFALFGYAIVYTLWLKRATPQNIVIGGLAGAAPPLLGWTAVTAEIHPYAVFLVLIIFLWTPPHFWALAIHRIEDYAEADIPMLPVTHGERYTKVNIVLYTVFMIISTLLPVFFGMSSWLYLIGAVLLGAGFLYWAMVMMIGQREDSGMSTFRYSIVYLMALFVIMLLDHYLLEPLF